MKRASRNIMFTAVILLFVLSFGYFIALYFLYLFKGALPEGFFNSGFGAFLDTLFFEEISALPTLICFGISFTLPVVFIAGFRRHFRRGSLVFTASAPLVLLCVHGGLGKAVYALLENASSLHSHAREAVLLTVSLITLIGYTIGFFTVLHRERKRMQCME